MKHGEIKIIIPDLLTFCVVNMILMLFILAYCYIKPELDKIDIKNKEIVDIEVSYIHQEETKDSIYKVYYKDNQDTIESFITDKKYYFDLIEKNIKIGDIITDILPEK